MSTYRFRTLAPQTFPLQTLLQMPEIDARSPFAARSELGRAMREVMNNGHDSLVGDGREDPTGFTLEFEVPGVDPESIEVVAEDGVLAIRGNRATSEQPEGTKELFAERPRGAFERRLRFPKSADLTAVTASYGLGVLTVRVAKVAPAQPRRVAVQIEAAS